MNRREFFEFLGRLSSAVIAAKVAPVALRPKAADPYLDGIYFDPISFDRREEPGYVFLYHFRKPFVGSTPLES